MSKEIGMNRRAFLRNAALVSAVVQVVPGHVLGLNGATPPSGKVNLAGIGVGGQGGSDLQNLESENIVALCDADWRHAAHCFKRYPAARQWKDYRKMLEEQKDIDAVVIGTPDHLHALPAMAAMKLGKHVYCEKPLTHSVWEARQLGQAARQGKMATQMGNQGQASEETRRLCEYLWAGAIGPVREVHVWTDRPSQGLFNEYWAQGVGRPKETAPVPEGLDWDLWLGPAPQRSYHPAYLPFKWRGWWDFGTGALGDIGCHALDPIFRALKLGAPESVQAASSRVNEETYPLASMVTYQFPARGREVQANNYHVKGLTGASAGEVEMAAVKLVWYDGGLRPPRPDGLPEGRMMGDNGRLLVGEKGFILGNSIFPESRRQEVGQIAKTIPRSQGHYKEWAEACKGGKPAGSNFDWAAPLAEAVLLGNVALRVKLREELTRARLLWDSANLKVRNVEEANRYIRRDYRPGWSL